MEVIYAREYPYRWGITASLAFAQFSNDNPLVLVGAGVIGALLPDICHRGSKIGRTFPSSRS